QLSYGRACMDSRPSVRTGPALGSRNANTRHAGGANPITDENADLKSRGPLAAPMPGRPQSPLNSRTLPLRRAQACGSARIRMVGPQGLGKMCCGKLRVRARLRNAPGGEQYACQHQVGLTDVTGVLPGPGILLLDRQCVLSVLLSRSEPPHIA